MKRINSGIFMVFLLVFAIACKNNSKRNTPSRVAALPFFDEATFTPKWIAPESGQLQNFHKIPSFKFLNQYGEFVTEKTFKDKVYVTNFFFTTCPGICPMMTNNMKKLQEKFKESENVLFLSHSVTPSKDSVAVLKEYALAHNIEKKWHLVTGNKKEIYNLGRNFYFVEENLGEPKGENDFLHTENFVLIDQKKHIRGLYNGLNRASIDQLIIDIQTLIKEKE